MWRIEVYFEFISLLIKLVSLYLTCFLFNLCSFSSVCVCWGRGGFDAFEEISYYPNPVWIRLLA